MGSFNKNSSTINQVVKLSDRQNIFLITYDGMNNLEMKDLILNKRYIDHFNDFTFFENFFTNSPSSKGSLSFELIGNKFSDYKVVNSNLKLINYVKNDQHNFINEKKINKNILSYYRLYTDEERLIDFSITDKSHFFFLVLERYIREAFVRFFTYKINDIFKLISSSYSKSKESFNQYGGYLERLNNAEKINNTVIHAGFWDFTHVPVNFDEKCNKLSIKEMQLFQNELGQKKLSECVTNLMIEFIEILKNLEIYNNSIILFKSDHGSPTEYFNDDDIRKNTISESSYGYGRYHPFLMVKTGKSEKFNLNNSVIMNTDIAPFVCNIINKDANCEKYGVNNIKNTLFHNQIIERRDEIFFIDEGHNKHQMDFLTPQKVRLENTKIQKDLINIFDKE